MQSRLIAGVSPIAAIAGRAACGLPPIGAILTSDGANPGLRGAGSVSGSRPHILLCTAHIIQPLTLQHFRLCQTLHCWTRLSDKTDVRTNGIR